MYIYMYIYICVVHVHSYSFLNMYVHVYKHSSRHFVALHSFLLPTFLRFFFVSLMSQLHLTGERRETHVKAAQQ